MSALGRPYITNNSAGNLNNGTYCQTEIGAADLGSLVFSEGCIDIIPVSGNVNAGNYVIQKKDSKGVWFNSSIQGSLVTGGNSISISWISAPLCPCNGVRVVISNLSGAFISEIEVNMTI